MKLPEGLTERWPELIILGATTALFAVKGLFSFLSLKTPAGRDLVGNYAFAWLMKQNLLHGEILRWSNEWLLGFPSFSAYPPLFFLITASLDLVSGGLVSLLAWFKLLVFGSVFLIPLATYWSFSRIFSRLEAFFAGFFTLYFLFVYPPVSQAYQVLSTGLVAQGFAFLLLFPALGFLFSGGRRSSILSGLLLGLTALTHPFVGLTGFLVAGSYFLLSRERHALYSAGIGLLIAGPWLLNAARYLPYFPKYTMGTARISISLLMIVPLVLLGGYREEKNRALLSAFAILLLAGTVELPVVTQEFRFFTYALGIGSVLAGLGAHQVYDHLSGKLHPFLLAALLLVPVAGLALQADTVQSWTYTGDAETVIGELDGMEPGRVLVESDNRSLYEAYVLQELIPVRTEHRAVNEVHLDASTSANYILTLENWFSPHQLYNPICRTCQSTAPPSLADQRLDSLGVRYVVAGSQETQQFADGFMEPIGKRGDFWLFENTGGYDIVEPLERKPVALVGEYEKWRAVNDRMFVSNISTPAVWLEEEPETRDRFSAVIRMEELTAPEVVERTIAVGSAPVPPVAINHDVGGEAVRIDANISAPVRVKVSWSPRHSSRQDIYASNFNTMLVYVENKTNIRLR